MILTTICLAILVLGLIVGAWAQRAELDQYEE